MLEITIPKFYDFETIKDQKGKTKQTLRDVCFDLTDKQPRPELVCQCW